LYCIIPPIDAGWAYGLSDCSVAAEDCKPLEGAAAPMSPLLVCLFALSFFLPRHMRIPIRPNKAKAIGMPTPTPIPITAPVDSPLELLGEEVDDEEVLEDDTAD